jgi:hypothetical protein
MFYTKWNITVCSCRQKQRDLWHLLSLLVNNTDFKNVNMSINIKKQFSTYLHVFNVIGYTVVLKLFLIFTAQHK